MRLALVTLLTLFALGCPSRLPPPEVYRQQPDPTVQEITLGVGDVIAVNVWDNKDLNTEIIVRPDGTVTIPLAGDIKAVGMTPSQLKAAIREKLKDYVKLGSEGELTVAVKQYNSYRFTVHGEVAQPGVFTAPNYVTVADAIAMAGGVTRFAKRGDMKLTRMNPKTRNVVELPLDYDALSSGRRSDMNIYILPGDRLFVP